MLYQWNAPGDQSLFSGHGRTQLVCQCADGGQCICTWTRLTGGNTRSTPNRGQLEKKGQRATEAYGDATWICCWKGWKGDQKCAPFHLFVLLLVLHRKKSAGTGVLSFFFLSCPIESPVSMRFMRPIRSTLPWRLRNSFLRHYNFEDVNEPQQITRCLARAGTYGAHQIFLQLRMVGLLLILGI